MNKVTLNGSQKVVKDWVKRKGFKWSTYAQYCHLVEEVGELGEALTVHEGERKAGSGSNALADHASLQEEFGDVLFSTLALADRLGIDAEDCFKLAIKRYDRKIGVPQGAEKQLSNSPQTKGR